MCKALYSNMYLPVACHPSTLNSFLCVLLHSDRCSAAGLQSQLRMYSFMGGGLFCAFVGNILLVVSTATDYWMQYRLSGSYANQGLWRYCMANKCYMQTDSIGMNKVHIRVSFGLISHSPLP